MRHCLLLVVGLALALSAIGAATAQNADPGTAALEELRTATLAGDPTVFQSLLSPGAETASLAEFVGRWLSRETTAVTLLERERGVGEGGSHWMLVEAFVEAGTTGRLATWALDWTPTTSGWRLRDAATFGVIDGLHELALDATRQLRARNLVVRAEDLELRLPEGDVFFAPTPDGTTAAVLLGRGEMVFDPEPLTERRQLRIFAGNEQLRTPFEAAFVRFHPSDSDERLTRAELIPVPVERARLARAQQVFTKEASKSFAVDLAALGRQTWSVLPSPGDFVAEVQTRRYGTLTYSRSGAQAEDVSVFDRNRRKTISTYASRERMAARGPFYDDQSTALFDLLDVDVDAEFTPSRLWMQGRTRLQLEIRAETLSSFTLRLAGSLVPRAVTSDRHGRLLYVRARDQNQLIVNLPSPVARGDQLTLDISDAGRLEPQAPGREHIGVMQEPIAPPREVQTILAQPEASWVYTNRSDWYPQGPVVDHATATIRLTVPEGLGAACSGEPVPGSPVDVRDVEARPRQMFVWRASKPIPYLACVVARFRDAGRRASEPRTSVDASADAPVGSVSLHLMDATRDRNRARRSLASAERIATFYQSLMGGAPYPRLTVAVLESLVPGGHAPAYLAMLHDPLPQTPFNWTGDPAAFEGFDDFYIAHEVAHQWWGQAVAWNNYHEQWLSEGFAQYFAALYAEHDGGARTFRDVLRRFTWWTRSRSHEGPVYLGYRIGHLRSDQRAYRAIVYNKGAMVLHMLRLLMGDAAFFEGLQRFYRAHRFATAGTGDLRTAMEQASGQTLEAFFDHWVFGQELPTASVTWQLDGEVVRLVVRQEGTPFVYPLPVTLVHTDGTRTAHVLTVRDKESTITLPLRGGLRTIEVNAEETVPVKVR
jgi:hypothetical protein